MNKLLKGNFKVKDEESINEEPKVEKKSHTQEFEEKSMEKLGGSIAFVMKKNKFIWDDSE